MGSDEDKQLLRDLINRTRRLGFLDENELERIKLAAESMARRSELTTADGDAQAQVFFLQGEKGDTGDKGDPGDGLSCDATTCAVSGDKRLIVEDLTVNNSYDLPDCPEGYLLANASNPVLCVKGSDEMVQVGDFWIDRYEMSVWSNPDCTGTQYGASSDNFPSGFPDNGNWTSPLYACSVPNEEPARYTTWFQAQQACVLSGKRLCSNAEWQAAAHGTPDPDQTDPGDDSEPCNIWTNSKPSASTWATTDETIYTGSASQCVSLYGAYDMIGNVFEWADDWYGQGGNSGNQGSAYSYDGYWNVDPAENQGNAVGFPAAALRSGAWYTGSEAGVFAVPLHLGPSVSGSPYGARCCRSW